MGAMKTADVVVVGAGPSGLRTAARLAASGLRVRVLERKPRAGAGVLCTGIVGLEVFDDFGLDRGSVVEELRAVRLVSPYATELLYEHPRAFAAVVDRERFDGALAEAAAAAGADVVCDTRVEDVVVGPDGVALTARDAGGGLRRETAEVAVLATGVDFALSKKLGLSAPRDFLKGAQVECAVPGADTTTYESAFASVYAADTLGGEGETVDSYMTMTVQKVTGVAAESEDGPVTGMAAAEAISALSNLGYNPGQASAAVAAALKELGAAADTAQLIRRGLKELAALSKRSAASSYLEPNKPQPLSFFSAFFSNSSARAI